MPSASWHAKCYTAQSVPRSSWHEKCCLTRGNGVVMVKRKAYSITSEASKIILDTMKILDVPQSGSVAGVTSSRNRFGQYRRTRAIPTNPQTALQTGARTVFGDSAALWRSLTQVQKDLWEQCALDYPKVDSLGQTIILSGFQMFVRANMARRVIGEGGLTVPGGNTAWTSNLITATAAAGVPALSIAFTVPTGAMFLVLDVSPQLGAGIQFPQGLRYFTHLDSAATSPENALAAYVARFGTLVAGKVIFIRARVLNECGVFSAAFVQRVVIAA